MAIGDVETGTVAMILFVAGSIRRTVAPVPATQTAPCPTAMATGSPGAAMVTTLSVTGSTRDTVLSRPFVTQMDPSPAAMPRNAVSYPGG